MVQEVRSGFSSPERERVRTGAPVSNRSPWSTSRADGAHLAGFVGKGAAARRDNCSEVVGEPQDVIDRR